MVSRPFGFDADEREQEELDVDAADRKFFIKEWEARNSLSDPREIRGLVGNLTDEQLAERSSKIPNIGLSDEERDSFLTQSEFAMTPEERRARQALSGIRDNFVSEVEAAANLNGPALLNFFMELDESDLVWFADPDFQKEVSEPILQAGLTFKMVKAQQEAQAELATALYEGEIRIDQNITDLFADLTPETPEEAAEMAQKVVDGELRLDAEGFFPETLQQIEVFITGGTPEGQESALAAMDFMGRGLQQIIGGAQAVEHLASFDGRSALASAFGVDTAKALTDFSLDQTGTEEARALTQERQQDLEFREDMKRQIAAGALPQAMWEELPETERALREEMYGSPELARMGFALEFQDLQSMPEIDEQIERMIDKTFEQAQAGYDAVDEANFMAEGGIMRILTVWNDIIDSIGAGVLEATVGTLDRDERVDMAREVRLGDFIEDVAVETSKVKNTPAGVLGMEGTFLGLMTNIGMGVILDPLNWFVGPGLKGGANSLASKGAIKLLQKGPAWKLYVKNMAKDLINRGPRIAHTMDNLAETGSVGEVLQSVGMGDPVLTDNLWLTHPKGVYADPAPTNLVMDLLDDVQRTQFDELDPKKIEMEHNRLLNQNSIDEPIIIEYDAATGRLSIGLEGDELVTLKALTQLNAERIPIVFRPAKASKVPPPARAWSDNAIPDNPEEFVYHGKAASGTERTEFTRGGFSADLERAEGYATTVTLRTKSGEEIIFNVDDLGRFPDGNVRDALIEKAQEYQRTNKIQGTLEVSEPEVVAVRKADLPEEAQARLEAGLDIEDLADFGDVSVPVAGRLKVEAQAVPKGPIGPTLDDLGLKQPSKIDTHIAGDGDEVFSPRQIFPDDVMGLEADFERLEAALTRHLENGGQLPGAVQSWGAVALGGFVKKLAQSGRGKWVDKYLRTSYDRNVIPGQGHMRRGLELVEFLKRDDAWAHNWMRRILRNEEALGKARTQTATSAQRLNRLRELDRRLSSRQMDESPRAALVEEAADLGIDDVTITRMATIDEIRHQLRAEIKAESARVQAAAMEAHGAQDWNGLYMELLDDYNRQFIATLPEWADDVDAATGLVPWERIHRGFDTSQLPGKVPSLGARKQKNLSRQVELREAKFEAEMEMTGTKNLEKMKQAFGGNEGLIDDITLPATPIELAAASERGGAAYTQLTQDMWAASIRYGAHFVDQLWKANVLISPRTFMVMSVDELTSLMHAGGVDFVRRYLQLRTDKWMSRIQGGKFNYRHGSQKTSAATQERLRTLDDLPAEQKAYESQIAEGVSREQILMEPGDIGYEAAAQAHSRQILENPAMRSYLRGRDAFSDWFKTSEGQEWYLSQTIEYVDDSGNVRFRPLRGEKEAFEYADLRWKLFERTAVAEGLDDIAAFRESFVGAAERAATERTGRLALPDPWVEQYYGPIPGYEPVYPGSSVGWQVVGRAFKHGAANPASFRQGLAADMMRIAEMERLRALFHSQGKKIVSDADLLDVLKTEGLDTTVVNQFNSSVIDQYLARRGVITEGYIARLAENRATDFVNDMTYAFERGSRFGRQGAAVAPFIRAWGDMFARWGRMLGSRAIARPWLQRAGLQSTVQKGLDLFPFNPRTAGFLSRVAGRSLEVTGGLFGERDTDLDFSPVTFLPNVSGGISALIPGLGIAPVGVVDAIIDHFGPDPVEEPIEYQRLLDNLSQLVPGIRLHGRGPIGRFAGGGLIGLVLGSGVEGQRLALQRPNRAINQFTGNIKAAVVANRSVKAAFSDPDIMMDLLSAESTDEAAALIMASLNHSAKQAAGQNLMEGALGWLIPARGGLDTNLDEIYGVWTRAARNNSELFPDISLPDDDTLRGDPELLLRTGDQIRRRFFSLPRWQKDLLVAANPTLAVNLVNSWEWGGDAPPELVMDQPFYRTTQAIIDEDQNLNEALARHENFVQHAWVVPRDHNSQPYEFIGTVRDANLRITDHLYESVSSNVNDFLWETAVSDTTRNKMQFALENVPSLKEIGITDERSLWEAWGSERRTVLDHFMQELGVTDVNPEYLQAVELVIEELSPEDAFAAIHEDLIEDGLGVPEMTEDQKAQMDVLLDAVRVPEAEEAWSTSWRGDIIENFSARFRESPVLLNDQDQQILNTLDIDLPENPTGEDFLSALMDYRSRTTKTPAWAEAKLHYENYINQRGASFAAGMTILQENIVTNQLIDDEFSTEVENFMELTDRYAEEYEGNIPRHIQDEIVEKFNRIASVGKDAPVDWDKVWFRAFQSRYGPRAWEPPPPAPVFMEDGTQNHNAWSPFVVDVIDGDTIEVSKKRGPSLLDIDLLPQVQVGGPEFGGAVGHGVRLIGVNAEDSFNNPEAAAEATQRLEDALLDARRNGDRIWLVRDPDYTGSHTDPFGRELAWLWIGDEPFYFPDELRRGD